MPKGVAKLENELKDFEYKLKHHDYLRVNARDPKHGWKLPTKETLHSLIAKTKSALEKAKSKTGGTRRRRGIRKTRRR